MYMITIILYVAVAVSFSKTAYSVDEGDGLAQPVLLLSSPSSTAIAVKIRNIDNTATSKYNLLDIKDVVDIYSHRWV